MVVNTSINDKRVIHTLDYLCWMRGLPEVITVHNGPEFTGNVVDNWAWRNGVKLDFSRPGKPVDNAFIENFNRSVRNECLKDNCLLSLSHAREVIEDWRNDYYNVRPHSALDGLTPAEFADQRKEFSQSLVLLYTGQVPNHLEPSENSECSATAKRSLPEPESPSGAMK